MISFTEFTEVLIKIVVTSIFAFFGIRMAKDTNDFNNNKGKYKNK
jgi:hypothetical protein